MNPIRVYKDWLITNLILLCKKRPLHLKTTIDYVFMTLKSAGFLHEDIRAMEVFGMYGLYLTKHYARFCKHVDMWEIDPRYVHYARKFKEPNVEVIEGDSVAAVKNNTIDRRYHLIMIDNPLISPYGNDLIEHFDLFPEILRLAENKCIIILNVILMDPSKLYDQYNFTSKQRKTKLEQWLAKRRIFYGSTTDASLKPQEYIKCYSEKFLQWGFNPEFITFLPRDERVGFIGFALRRNSRK